LYRVETCQANEARGDDCGPFQATDDEEILADSRSAASSSAQAELEQELTIESVFSIVCIN
jgi:hypothetical protein